MLKNIKGFFIGLVSVIVVSIIVIGCYVYFSSKPKISTLGSSYTIVNTSIKDSVGFNGFPELNSSSPVSFANYYYASALYKLVCEYNIASQSSRATINKEIENIRSHMRVLDSTVPQVASNNNFMNICLLTDSILNNISKNGYIDYYFINRLKSCLEKVELLDTVNSDKFGDLFIYNFNHNNKIIITRS